MTKMIPQRIIGIGANFALISYGALAPIYPVLALHAFLLPLLARCAIASVLAFSPCAQGQHIQGLVEVSRPPAHIRRGALCVS